MTARPRRASPRARRWTAIGLVAAAALWVPFALGRGPAAADEQDRVTIFEGQTLTREYDPIPANDPVRPTAKGEGGLPPVTPEECRQTPLTCDVIPVTVRQPADTTKEFLIRFTVGFEAERVAPLLNQQDNDLDLYLWHDPAGENTVTHTPANPDDEGDPANTDEDNPGASQRNPERINLFTTRAGNYQLVVNNFVGRNTGYTLKLEFVTGDLVTPFESLDPDFVPPVDRSDPSNFEQPPASSGASGGGPGPGGTSGDPGTAAVAPIPALPPAEFVDDAAFDVVEGRDLDAALTAPPSTIPFATQDIGSRESPSTATLLLWFGLVPLVLLATAGALVRQTAPVTLRVHAAGRRAS